MSFYSRSLRALALFGFLLPAALPASAPPPVVLASRSPNGKFLVVTDYELAPEAGPLGGRKIISTTYRVLAVEPFLNSKDRLLAPVPFFTQKCKITLKIGDQYWPMVADDGTSVVLVGVQPPWPKAVALRIFRCDSVDGVPLRDITLSELWTPAEVDPTGQGRFMATDDTPQWFAGGSLSFSSNGKLLLYRSQWGDRLQIRLRDGEVRRVS